MWERECHRNQIALRTFASLGKNSTLIFLISTRKHYANMAHILKALFFKLSKLFFSRSQTIKLY